MSTKSFTTINLPTPLVEELKIWRMAFCSAYGRSVTYGEMIRGMLNSLEDSDPSVFEEMGRILTKHPGLWEKMPEQIGTK